MIMTNKKKKLKKTRRVVLVKEQLIRILQEIQKVSLRRKRRKRNFQSGIHMRISISNL